MTTPDLSLAIDADPRWAQVDYRLEPRAWADAAAERIWTNTGQAASRDGRVRLAIMLASLVPATEDRPLAMCMFCPEPWVGPVAVVQFQLTSRAEGDLPSVLGMLALPEALRTDPVDESQLSTKAGPAIRLRQHYREPGESAVWELAVWVWWLEALGVALIASTTFLDPAVGDRWVSAIDDYLAGVEVVDTLLATTPAEETPA
jgi:hypothetical protein